MFSPSVELTKDGVLIHAGGETEPYEISDVCDLLHLWHWRLEGLDPEFTLGDLAALLRSVEDVDTLSCLLNSPVGEILGYEGDGEDKECPLRCLEVCNAAEPTVYRPDPHHPDQPVKVVREGGEIVENALPDVPVGFHGTAVGIAGPDDVTGEIEIYQVIAPVRHGSWEGPYHLRRSIRGLGMPRVTPPAGAGPEQPGQEREYSLFFVTPPDVAHLPLRYNPGVTFSTGERGGERVTWQAAITVGEFLYAVFRGMGFNGPPEHRRAMWLALGSEVGEAGQDGDVVPEP